MPPKKKLKLKLNYTPADPESSTETDDRAARRAAHLAARRSAREDFDPPFNIEDEDERDENEDEDDIDEENRDTDEGSEPESDEVRQVRASTQSNTFLNNGFETAEGQRVAQQHPGNIRDEIHLWILTRARRDSPPTDRDAPSKSVEREE